MEDTSETARMAVKTPQLIQLYSSATPNGIKVSLTLIHPSFSAVKQPQLIQLYSFPTPNGIKVAWALEELCDLRSHKEEFQYEPHSVDLRQHETRTGMYTKIAPHGKIPAIVDPHGPDGKSITVFESGAILLYLAEKYRELIPCDNEALRMETIKWLFWATSSFSAQAKLFGFYYKFCTHAEPYCTQRYAKETTRLLGVLDQQLAAHGRHWIIGDLFTIADIAAAPWVFALYNNYGDAITAVFDDLKAFPHVVEWYHRCMARPAVQRAINVCPIFA